MSASVNKVILIANLCADPEVRKAKDGSSIANLRVATNETWRDKSTGERKSKSEFHTVVVFNEALVKVCESYLRKGSKIYLEGALQTRKWTDQSGVERFATEIVLARYRGEIVMLDGKSEGGGGGSHAPAERPREPREMFNVDLDDDVPF